MQDLRDSQQYQKNKNAKVSFPKFNLIIFFITYKPLIYKSILVLSICCVLFFPKVIAMIISTWVNNFIGTLVHNINL